MHVTNTRKKYLDKYLATFVGVQAIVYKPSCMTLHRNQAYRGHPSRVQDKVQQSCPKSQESKPTGDAGKHTGRAFGALRPSCSDHPQRAAEMVSQMPMKTTMCARGALQEGYYPIHKPVNFWLRPTHIQKLLSRYGTPQKEDPDSELYSMKNRHIEV